MDSFTRILLFNITSILDDLRGTREFFWYSVSLRVFIWPCWIPFSHSMILGASAQPDLDLRDPVCDDFFQLWQETAENNANIYEQVGVWGVA